ncbi:MAG: ABC transporter permease [Acidobacteria bacterium]|nr:ABC transporter permease [Acidobacteriota bacterium]MBV9476800.1 ABC transporter permease [Acidobacteriota bacterium]
MKALLLHELRSVLAAFRRRPLVPFIATSMLALGFAANVAVFTVISRTLLRPLPYARAERIVVPTLTFIGPGQAEDPGPAGSVELVQWKLRSRVFTAIEGVRDVYMTLRDRGEPQGIAGSTVTGGIFRLFGVRPIVGRDFAPEDDVPNARVVILSHGCWQRRFGGDANAIGRTIFLDGKPMEIIGVMPRGFEIATVDRQPEIFVPAGFSLANMPTPTSRGYHVFGRLRDGATLQQGRGELRRITADLGREYPATEQRLSADVQDLREAGFGKQRHALLVLWLMVAVVYVLACVNVASLLSAQIADERGITALRLVFGAGRWEIVRYRLLQTLITTLAGAVAGYALGRLVLRVVLANVADPKLTNPVEHVWVMPLFLLAVSLVTGIAVGLVPALRETRTRLTSALSEQSTRMSSSVRATRLREAFIVTEVALAVPLLLATAATIHQFRALQQTPLGFDTRNVLISQIVVSPKYDKVARARFARELIRRIEAMPGVETASTTTCFFTPGNTMTTSVGSDRLPEPMSVNLRRITPHYFRAMRMPLVAGRAFTDGDGVDAPPVVIISASLAKRLYPNENALGKRVLRAPPAAPATIVGIAPDVYDEGASVELQPTYYSPYLQTNNIYITIVVKTKVDPLTLREPVRRAVWSLDRDVTPSNEAALADLMHDAIGNERLQMQMLTGFGLVALLLATVGIYGMTSYAVASRTREIGVRLAFGATPRDVIREIVGRAVRSVSIGLLAGALLSLVVQRVASALIYAGAKLEWQSVVAIGAVLFAAALVAAAVPSMRTRAVQPVWLLREGN